MTTQHGRPCRNQGRPPRIVPRHPDERITMTDQTAAHEVLARLLCAADAHVHGNAPWEQLYTTAGRGVQGGYRDAARWLLPRMTVATAPAAVPVPPPADQTALRDRIRRVLCVRDGQGALWGTDMLEPDEYGADADAVLAVLPEQADRAAVLRSAADTVEAMNEGCGQSKPCASCDARTDAADALRDAVRRVAAEEQPAKPDRCPHGCDTSICPCLACAADEEQSAADEADVDLANGPVCCPLCPNTVTLHTPNGARAHFTVVHPEQRITGRGPGPWPLLVTDGDEAQPGTERPAAEEQPAAGCWCGHPRDRHWAGSTRMTFPDGCHDCRDWNGAHAYGQELPWADDERPAVGEQPETQETQHLGGRANAEDCPACTGTNPPYPFLCPGPDAP